MTNRKTTRRALTVSIISLLLCVSMLVGTTFAWFTDSVTSGKNQIIAGNLDIELKYAKVVDGQITGWADVKDSTEIFDPNALWEPGHVEVVYLQVTNEGTLALKYQLGVNVASEIASTSVLGNELKLSDHLVFKVVEMDDALTTYTDREAVAAAAGTEKGLKDYNGVTKALDPKGEANDTDYVALIVYMPETVGNEANYRGTRPEITLGVNLFATQKDAETDSFGPDYDKDAWDDALLVTNEADLNAAVAAGGKVMLGADVALTEAVEIPAGVTVELNMNGKKLSNDNGYVFENQGNLTIDGNGTFEGMGIIRSKAGSITINNGNFYASSQWQNGVYQHTLKAENTEVVINGGVFDATVKGQTNAMFNASENGTITINGGSFKNVAGALGSFDPYIFTYEKNGKLIINDGTFYGGWRFNGETATTDIYGGDFTVGFDGQSFNATSTHVLTVYGGTFTKDTTLAGKLSDVVADGFKTAETGNKVAVVPNGVDNVISTAAELQALGGTKINGTYLLLADIDMASTAMKPMEVSGGASVTFEGNGHTISNLTLGAANIHGMTGSGNEVAGLFDLTAPATKVSLTVNDLTVKNATVECNGYAAVIAGYNSNGGTVITLNNVDVSTAKVTAETVAALVGYTTGAVNLTNCDVSGLTLTGEEGRPDKVGAYVGTANTATCAVTVVNCTNGTSYRDYGRVIGGATWNGGQPVSTVAELTNAIKNAPVGEVTTIYLASGTYAEDMEITVAALGKSGGDVVIKAMEGATPVISGTVTLGYRNQGVGSTMYNANVTFEGVTFDHAEAQKHSLDVQDVKSLTLTDCTIIGDGEYGITSARGNGTGTSKIVGCTFENAGMQLLGNFATGLVIDDCTFNDSCINVQAGNGVTVQNCVFNATLTDARVGDSFYMIRSNSTPITVKDCEINIDSTVTGVATAQAKWYLLANRGTTNWTVENVKVTLTEAALAQTELQVTACTSTGKINTTNLTVNGVVK